MGEKIVSKVWRNSCINLQDDGRLEHSTLKLYNMA